MSNDKGFKGDASKTRPALSEAPLRSGPSDQASPIAIATLAGERWEWKPINAFGEDGYGLVTQDGYGVAWMSAPNCPVTYDKERARLIAAAPDLLNVLLAIRDVDGFQGWHHKYREAIELAEAAISKATSNP